MEEAGLEGFLFNNQTCPCYMLYLALKGGGGSGGRTVGRSDGAVM